MTTAEQARADHDLFVDTVRTLCQDPAARKALARGRGRRISHCAEAHRYLAATVFHHPVRQYAPRAHYTVACLIAATSPRRIPAQPPPAEPPQAGPSAVDTAPAPAPPADDAARTGNAPATPSADEPAAQPADMQAVWRRRPNLGRSLAEAVMHQALAHDSAARRLRALGRLSTDLLHPRLPALTALLDRAGGDVDFAVLLNDLTWWDTDRARITSAWTLSFHLALSGGLPAPADLVEMR